MTLSQTLTGERTPEGDVVRLYRKRWQIALSFRWVKHVLAQRLEPLRPCGVSRACWLRVRAVTLLSALRLSG